MKLQLIVAAGMALGISSAALGQCQPVWLPGGPSVNGPTPSAMTVWNRGGSPMLVVAGNTGAVAPDAGVAVWTGSSWEGLGAQVPDSTVSALLADGDELYIGGSFLTLAGMQGQAGFVGRLGPSGWSGLPNYLAPVKSLAMYQGDLIAGGLGITFLQPMPARWTGAGWVPLGAGVNDDVNAMLEFEGDLIVAGGFTTAGGQPAARVARWDGQAWHAMGLGFNNFQVAQLAVHEGILYALGSFSASGTTALTARLAMWTGTAWAPVGTPPGRASSMLSDPSGLLVTFTPTGGGSGPVEIHRWTGAAWEPYAANPPGADGGVVGADGPMIRYQGDLLADGRGLVAWNGSEWELMGDQSRALTASVASIVEFGGRVVIAGDLDSRGFTAGLPGLAIAAWNGSQIEPFSAVPPPGPTDVLLNSPQGLLAIGQYAWPAASRTLAARWDGQTWVPYGAAIPPFEYRFGGAAIANGRLYVIESLLGTSSLAGGITDATGPTLQSVGNIDLTGVRGIVEHQGQACIVADGATLGVPPAALENVVAAWNGSAWSVLGDTSVFADAPTTIASHNGLLVVGGEFDGAIGRHISAWNGTQWQPMGAGLPSAPVSLAVIDGVLHAVGIRIACGAATPCGGFATWDGLSWTVVQTDPTSHPFLATGHGDEVFFTGSFSKAISGYSQGAFARYGVPQPDPCPADLTAGAIPGQPGYGLPNGSLTNDDFFYYLAQFAAGNIAIADLTSTAMPSDPCYGRPNGILNNDDFFYFLAAFAAGC